MAFYLQQSQSKLKQSHKKWLTKCHVGAETHQLPLYYTTAVAKLSQEIIFNFVFWKTCFTTTAKVGIVVPLLDDKKKGLVNVMNFFFEELSYTVVVHTLQLNWRKQGGRGGKRYDTENLNISRLKEARQERLSWIARQGKRRNAVERRRSFREQR